MNANTKAKLIDASKTWDTRPIIHLGIRSCHREVTAEGIRYGKQYGLDVQVMDLKETKR